MDALTDGFWVGQTPLEKRACELQVLEPANGQLAHDQVVDFQAPRCGPTDAKRFEPGLPTRRQAGDFRSDHVHVEPTSPGEPVAATEPGVEKVGYLRASHGIKIALL